MTKRKKIAKGVMRETHIRAYMGDKAYIEYIRKKYGKKSLQATLKFILSKVRGRKIL